MISWAKLGASRVQYYESSVCDGRESYYSGRGESPGRFVGEGCRMLEGASGELKAGQLAAMSEGRHPVTRDQLAAHQMKIGAYDLTMSAPKSISLLYAAGGDLGGEIRGCHERAVDATIAMLEQEAAFVRRGKGGHDVQRAEGLAVAAFTHRTSRAGDPQLHTHAIVSAMAPGRDGRWTALYSIPLRDFKKAAGAIYRAELRANVRETLGLEWGDIDRKGLSELQGFDKKTLRDFSKRREQILEKARGSTDSPAAMAGAALETRRAKRAVDWPAIQGSVREAFEPVSLSTIVDKAAPAVTVDLERLAGPFGLTEMKNSFRRQEVIEHIAAQAPQGMRAADILALTDSFLERKDLVVKLEGDRYSTVDLQRAERARESAQLGRVGERTGIARDKSLRDGVRGLGLNGGQEDVVRSVFTSGRGVEIVEAAAGTGKTFTASAIRQVAEIDDRPVVGVAPTGRARDELQSQAGIDSHTIDSLLGKLEREDVVLTRRTVIVFDEAGMSGTRPAARLERYAQDAGCKLVEIGDSRQLQSVLAGGELKGAHEQLGGLELTDVIRQHDVDERRALGRLRANDVGGYITHKESQGRVHYSAGLDQAVDRYLTDAREVGCKNATLAVPTNSMANEANRLARERLAGELGNERTHGGQAFAVGERVMFKRNDGFGDSRVSNGDRGTVIGNGRQALEVELDSGGRRYVQGSYIEAGELVSGYAATIHKHQGQTVDRCVVATYAGAMDSELAYVAASRARDDTTLYVVDDSGREDDRAEIGPVTIKRERDQRAELIQAMSNSRAEPMAIDQQVVEREPPSIGLEL